MSIQFEACSNNTVVLSCAFGIESLRIFVKNFQFVIYPHNFEEKIGFGNIRQLVRQFCISEMGLELADGIAFTDDLQQITESLSQTDDMLRLMDEGIPFPIRDYFDLRAAFQHLRIEGTYIEQEDLFDLKISLENLNALLRFLSSEAALEYPSLVQIAKDTYLDNQLLKELRRIVDDKGEIPDNASPELADIRRDIRQKQSGIERKIRQILQESKSAGWSDVKAEITIRNGRMVVPVRAADKRSLKGFIHDESATGQTVYIEPSEIFETNNDIRELEYAERREIQRILVRFTNLMRPSLDMLLQAWNLLGEIDFINAKALFAKEIEAIKPMLEPFPFIDWKQAVHPLLERSLREHQKHAVPLDVYMHDKERIVVISGPNAGGKSVCLKTVGLLQYMLQSGLHVPVDEGSVFGVFKKLFIDIGDEQSLENDLSTYSSHLLHMKNFLEFTDANSLFLIDEFGTGTEPQSGGAIAEVVLEELNKRAAFGLVTTHYANLKLLAGREDGIVNGAMLYDNKKMEPRYILSIGKPGSSFAFEIARKTGLPEALLQKAADITGLSQLNFEQQLQQLDIDKAELAKKQRELDLAEEVMTEVVGKYRRLHNQLEERRKGLMKQANKEAQELIDKANKKIEHTIRQIKEAQAEKSKTKKVREELLQLKPELEKETLDKSKDKLQQVGQEEELAEIKVGDTVRIEEMDVEGELVFLSEQEAVVVFNSVKLRTSPEKISRLSKSPQKDVLAKARRVGSQQTVDLNEKLENFRLTIDVRGQRAEEAVDSVSKYLDESLLLSVKEVSILHGKGNGILRQVIREFLSSQKEVASFEDAPLQAGGTGITRVKLR